MKIRMEIDGHIEEVEIVIRCNRINNEILTIQQALEELLGKDKQITFFNGDTEYYFPLEQILFFETEDNGILAHTTDNVYQVKYKLYELEEILPKNFMRVSKSTILNIEHIYSITRNLSASSEVEFQGTHKQVFVSRLYYRELKNKLMEKRK